MGGRLCRRWQKGDVMVTRRRFVQLSAAAGVAGDAGARRVHLVPEPTGCVRHHRARPRTQRLNAEPVVRPEFVDSNVTSGIEYTYYVTAVDTDDLESAPSESVKVTAGVIVLSLNDVSGEPGSVVRVPINCANATNIKTN